jgi:hypothetical protein
MKNIFVLGPILCFLLVSIVPARSPDLITQMIYGIVAVIIYCVAAWIAVKQAPTLQSNRNGLWFAICGSIVIAGLDYLWIIIG